MGANSGPTQHSQGETTRRMCQMGTRRPPPPVACFKSNLESPVSVPSQKACSIQLESDDGDLLERGSIMKKPD